MDENTEQSIHVTANDSDEPGDDDINADEEISEVMEDEMEELEKSASVAEEAESDGDALMQEQDEPINDAHDHGEQSKPHEYADKSGKEKDEPKLKDEGKENPNKKLLRMQLSTQTLQKLLKEGKMEKLPTGSFRISADALRELKKETSDVAEDEKSSAETVKKRKLSASDDYSEEEEQQQSHFPRKKITNLKKKATVSKNMKKITAKKESKLLGPSDKKKDSMMQKAKSTVKPHLLQGKRASLKKASRLHNYVSDFNSSEDEDELVVNQIKDSLAELAPTKAGRLTKPVSLLFEELHNAMFGNISDEEQDEDEDYQEDRDEEERIKELALSDPDFGATGSSSNIGDIPSNFWMVGRIGDDDNTKMCIRSTGKRRLLDGSQYPVYNIDTGVGSVTTVTPLVVTALKVQDDATDKGSGLRGLDKQDPDLIEQLNQKTVSLRKYKEQVKVLRERYLKLARKIVSQPQLQTIGDLVAASSRFLTQDQLLFFTMQLKAGCDVTQGARFSTREKLLSLALYQQHPDTYKWLHRLFHLPSTAVLERWLDTVARGNPKRVKQLMYHVYTRYSFRPRDDMIPHALAGY